VLRAYQEQCAICRLRHRELLEAAHILPDGDPRGEPIVSNGVALCELHHAAFDRYILGIRPDLVVDLRLDVLREADGPMLQHGLQGFQGVRIAVPHEARLQPNRDWLAERYESSRERARHVTLCVVHSASNRRWAPVDSTGAAMAALRP